MELDAMNGMGVVMGAGNGGGAPPGCRVCFAIEATSAMAGPWPDYRQLYIEPVLRVIDNGLMGPVELAVVVFRAQGMGSDALVESSGWLRSVTEVRQVMDNLQLACGALQEVAVSEALAECVFLQTLPTSLLNVAPGSLPQCHCVVLAASEFSKVPTAMPFPNSSGQCLLNYAEIAASILKTHNISISVVGLRIRMNNLVYFFFANMLGLPRITDVHAHLNLKKVSLPEYNVSMDKTSVALVPKTWMAREVLQQEKIALCQQQAAAAQQAALGGPAPGLTPPGSVPLDAAGMGGYGQQQRAVMDSKRTTTPMGMIPTPPSAPTPPMGPPSGPPVPPMPQMTAPQMVPPSGNPQYPPGMMPSPAPPAGMNSWSPMPGGGPQVGPPHPGPNMVPGLPPKAGPAPQTYVHGAPGQQGMQAPTGAQVRAAAAAAAPAAGAPGGRLPPGQAAPVPGGNPYMGGRGGMQAGTPPLSGVPVMPHAGSSHALARGATPPLPPPPSTAPMPGRPMAAPTPPPPSGAAMGPVPVPPMPPAPSQRPQQAAPTPKQQVWMGHLFIDSKLAPHLIGPDPMPLFHLAVECSMGPTAAAVAPLASGWGTHLLINTIKHPQALHAIQVERNGVMTTKPGLFRVQVKVLRHNNQADSAYKHIVESQFRAFFFGVDLPDGSVMYLHLKYFNLLAPTTEEKAFQGLLIPAHMRKELGV